MVILHISCITDNPFNGVCVAVPQHVAAQQQYADVALLNITNVQIKGVKKQLAYEKSFSLARLQEPFCRPDLVVFHEAYRKDYLAISAHLRQNGVPYLIVPHGELSHGAQHKKWFKKKLANFLLFNHFINHSAAVQCLSEQELASTSFGKRRFVGTNGIAMPAIKKIEFHADRVELIYIGRLDAYHKGLDLMLEAVQLCAGFMREHRCRLSIYGPDLQGRYAHIEELIRSGNIGDVVRLHHEVAGKEKEEQLLSADIFIQTSRFEGMPLGILEAMSYGIPCLVTRETNLGDQIESANAGWMAGLSPEGIASKIKQAVIEKDMWLLKGENALNFVRMEFSWDMVANAIVGVYQQLLNGEK